LSRIGGKRLSHANLDPNAEAIAEYPGWDQKTDRLPIDRCIIPTDFPF
jgi:hypothetical protein